MKETVEHNEPCNVSFIVDLEIPKKPKPYLQIAIARELEKKI